MSIERRERIAELTWNRQAVELRTSLLPKLTELGDYEFLDKKESMKIGNQFWSIVEKLEYDDANNFNIVLADLERTYHDKHVLWLHRHTNETGVIAVKLSVLINKPGLLSEFGPDIAFTGRSFEFGLLFEKDENNSYFRWWCG